MRFSSFFLDNSKALKEQWNSRDALLVLHLNIALVTHSCAPNAINEQMVGEDICHDLAFKNICKGEEITICYFSDVKTFGSIQRKRKTAFKKDHGFDCKCPVCLDQVTLQEKTSKKLIELHKKLNPTPSDWKREAGIWNRIFNLNMELNIGHPLEKSRALDALLRFSHLARDMDLRRKALDKWRQLAERPSLRSFRGSTRTGRWYGAVVRREFKQCAREERD